MAAVGLALGLGPSPPPARAAEPQAVLRVGVVEGAQPCSYREAGSWRGIAVDLWNSIASREGLPTVFSPWPSPRQLLQATAEGRVDVAVGCLNVSPERLAMVRFSLPFQEDGLAVLVLPSRRDLGRAFLASFFGPTLLQLLGGFLGAIALITLLTWGIEGYGRREDTHRVGPVRTFTKLFQILATGPGSNTIVETTRGNALVILSYLVRIVAASLLVGYLTVTVGRELQERGAGGVSSAEDLLGLRVGLRRGTVSEELVKDLNRKSGGAKATIVPLESLAEGLPLLEQKRVDALVGDTLQLTDLLARSRSERLRGARLVLEGIRPESQAFAFSPLLPAATAERVDLAISALKRSGAVAELRRRAMAGPLAPGSEDKAR